MPKRSDILLQDISQAVSEPAPDGSPGSSRIRRSDDSTHNGLNQPEDDEYVLTKAWSDVGPDDPELYPTIYGPWPSVDGMCYVVDDLLLTVTARVLGRKPARVVRPHDSDRDIVWKDVKRGTPHTESHPELTKESVFISHSTSRSSFFVMYPVDITLRPPLWQDLFPELMDLVFQHSAYGTNLHRHYISRLSLMCRRMTRLFRPKLFQELHLTSDFDIQTLLAVLYSPLSCWLRDHILRLEISYAVETSSWATLLKLLPCLEKLELGSLYQDNPTSKLFWREQPTLRKLASITTLRLNNYHFPSPANLLRSLAALPNLKDVLCYRVKWNEALLGASPWTSLRKASFESLQEIHISHCTDPVILLQPFVVASIQAPSSYRPLQEEDTAYSVQAHATIQLVSMLHRLSQIARFTEAWKVHMTGGSYAFVIRTSHHFRGQYHFRFSITTKPFTVSDDTGRPQTLWAVSRVSIWCNSMRDALTELHTFDWTEAANIVASLHYLESFELWPGKATISGSSFAELDAKLNAMFKDLPFTLRRDISSEKAQKFPSGSMTSSAETESRSSGLALSSTMA